MRTALALGAVLLLTACGTNRPTIPDDYKQTTTGDAGNYPPGPYATGITKGAVIENFTFAKGWMDPVAANYDKAKLAPISFADFYDPDGSTGTELLLINTAAFWCGACKNEHGGTGTEPSLNDRYAQFHPRGLEILSLVFQDSQNNPVNEDDLVTWATNYSETFPIAADPDYQEDVYASSASAPLNLLVDARSMKIIYGDSGDHPTTLWPLVDQELSARGK